MPTIVIRGKDKVLDHYKSTNDPYWKLYVSDSKSPIQQNLFEKKMDKSSQHLSEMLDSIDPNGVYVLETYSAAEKNEQQKFLRAATSTCFALSEGVAGTEEKKGDNSGRGSSISTQQWLDIMRENTQLAGTIAANKIQIEHLNEKILEQASYIDELETELDEFEEFDEEEEEEEASVTGVPKNMEQALGKVLVDNSDKIIDMLSGFFNKGGKKIEDDIPDEEPEEKDPVQMSGIAETKPTTIAAVCEELKKHDPKLFKHLYKLVLVAEQKPDIFKMFLTKLEEI